MNGGIKETELPEQFDSDNYQVLLVATNIKQVLTNRQVAYHVC